MTELVFILDRSGSMAGLEADTIGGFNSMIAKQKKEAGEALVSTVLFDNESVVIHDRLPLEKVPPMTEKEYFTRGCTALLDAVGGAIHHIGNIHKYARREDVPEKTMFIITTDGYENASRRYSYETVRGMIERQKEKYGWEFLFLGANIDAAREAARFGIGADRAVNYKCDEAGTALNYEVISEAVCCVRAASPLILDRSGSMAGLEADTIGGFNSMIAKQKKEAGEALVSTVLFDNESVVIHDRLPLEKVPPMTEKEYFTRGCTALLDAVGGAIHHIGNIHKYARREDVPEKTMFIITTDGYENASRRYSYETVRGMIERQKEKYGWEFLFLGANIDAAREAARFGIGADRAVNYKCDEAGTALNYEVISEAVCCVRAASPLSADWKRRIDEDVEKRGR